MLILLLISPPQLLCKLTVEAIKQKSHDLNTIGEIQITRMENI
jgi:hypothetical protein